MQALVGFRHAAAQSLNLLEHIPAHNGVVLLSRHQVVIAAGGDVQVVQGGQRCRTSRQQRKRTHSLDLLYPTDRLGRMRVNGRCSLVLLGVVQRLDLALAGLVRYLV